MSQKLKLIFMGTPQFSVPILEALIKAGHEVCAVYSQPPKPAGRGHEVRLSPIHETALKHAIDVRTPQSLKDENEQTFFENLKADAVVVAAYGLLLPTFYLETPKFGCINVHTSLLPRWRGSSPIHRALLAGDDVTGVTIMQMDEGMDTGPMLLQKTTSIEESDTLETLHDRLSHMGAEAIVEVLENIATLTPQEQPSEGVTHAPKITKEDGVLAFDEDVLTLQRKIQALNPWPSTTFVYKGEVMKVRKAKALECMHDFKPGEVIDDGLNVACKNGILQFLEVQRAGKKALPVTEFLKGCPISKGEVLT